MTLSEKPKVEIKVSIDRGVETREAVCPVGWIVIDTYHPHSTPWDYYGNGHIAEFSLVLNRAGIDTISLITHHRRTVPMGSGPGGRVRFGDDMMPSLYQIAIKPENQVKALEAIAAHNQSIKDWLDKKTEMPQILRDCR